MLAVKK